MSAPVPPCDGNSHDIPYTQFACVGAGFSGIGLGATLQRWYGISDIQIFERSSDAGGTWYANDYPGAACDVPSSLYSFSFEPNPGWTRVLPRRRELWDYQVRVARKYNLLERTRFHAEVRRCQWLEERARWLITICDLETGVTFYHEAQFLFSAMGQLVHPRELDVPGVDTFQGPIIHSARWRHDVDLNGKKVVVLGNGCTATQLVPAIVERTAHLTHMVRSKHWLVPSIDGPVPSWMVSLKSVPGFGFLHRFLVYYVAEKFFLVFSQTPEARKFRKRRAAASERYMRRASPAKYHDMLIPDFEIGCKRRIFDAGYLKSLHRENITLTDESALEVVPGGVRTAKGLIEADVIVNATGFKTSAFFAGVEMIGRGGKTIQEHWDEIGGPEAYNTTSMSAFPNFFALIGEYIISASPCPRQTASTGAKQSIGPNTATGHTSTIMAVENSINFSLRVIRPCLDGKASVVNVRHDAEEKYSQKMQAALKETVWFSGCSSWYNDVGKDGQPWNSTTYPWSQKHFWYHCLFPTWNHWEYSVSQPLLHTHIF